MSEFWVHNPPGVPGWTMYIRMRGTAMIRGIDEACRQDSDQIAGDGQNDDRSNDRY